MSDGAGWHSRVAQPGHIGQGAIHCRVLSTVLY